MNKYIFLLPLYNDWESFLILIDRINSQMKSINKTAEILVINDYSSLSCPEFHKLSNITNINILNLKKNVGSQKAISIGLKYLENLNKDLIITILDSDGEDDTNEITKMIKYAEENNDKVVVSTRTKRHENTIFKLLYPIHKLITFIFTLQWISFGNFSAFSSKQLNKIIKNNSSWLAFSASVAKNCQLIKLKAERKKRIIGTSKLSFYGLILHSLRVNAVFVIRAFILSLIYLIILSNVYLLIQIKLFLVTLIMIFNFLLITTIFFNNQKEFINSTELIDKKI